MRLGVRRPKRAAMVLAAVGLGVGASLVYASIASKPEVEGASFAGGRFLTAPLQRDAIAVRVRTDDSAKVVVRVRSAAGKALTEGVSGQTHGSHTSTFQLPVNAAGRERLGRCSTDQSVKLEVRTPISRELLYTAAATIQNDAVRCAPLRWAPPVLEHPEVVEIGPGQTRLKLEPRDYELVLPDSVKVGGLAIEGGRNIVIRGGHITLPASAASGNERRAIHIENAIGTVHIEGVLIDSSGGGSGDAISIDAPQAVVQVENVRAVGLRGGKRTVHADVIQPWGGVRELRVDRLTGSSTYQGLQIPIDLGPIGSASIHDADLTALPGLEAGGGHMLWLASSIRCAGYPLMLEEVYVAPRKGRNLGSTVWPQANPSRCPAQMGTNTASWRGLPVKGGVRGGTPAGGQFVPWAVPGAAYKSPGYVAPVS